MPSQKPRVFISSTVYDFRDLRSALKFWLEELGYEVLLSENNDFPVQVDVNSYEACLRAIDTCDYFILLVGGRVGGWYDAANRISITQTEYRRAYEHLKVGGLKLLVFVRQDLWSIREDRKEVVRVIKSEALHDAELREDQLEKITTHPGKFANDADFVFSFLQEIARIEEMKAATKGEGSFPVGNWIRQFITFRDVIDGLRVEFRVTSNLRRVALLENLKAEIVANLKTLTSRSKHDNSIMPYYGYASRARDEFSGGIDDESAFTERYLCWAGIFAAIGCGVARKLATAGLDEAASSGEFLEFDGDTDAFVIGPFQSALLSLKQHIERLRHAEELLDVPTRISLVEQFRHLNTNRKMRIRNVELLPLFALHDLQYNVVALLKAVFRAASGDQTALDDIDLYGPSPLEAESELVSEETNTAEQIETWIIEGS